jgi:hypothetical protein
MSFEPFSQPWFLVIIRQLSRIFQCLVEMVRWLAVKSGLKSFSPGLKKSKEELTVFDGLTLLLFDRKLSPETLESFIKKLDDWPRSDIKYSIYPSNSIYVLLFLPFNMLNSGIITTSVPITASTLSYTALIRAVPERCTGRLPTAASWRKCLRRTH